MSKSINKEKTNKDYVLACAKAQGKISKLLLNYGEGDSQFYTYMKLRDEIELLKECFLVEDIFLWNKVKGLKKGGKKHLGSCYESPFGWGGSPTGGWGGAVGGVYVSYDDGTDNKPLPFGRSPIKHVGVYGDKYAFFPKEEEE